MKWIKGGNVVQSCFQLTWLAGCLIQENKSTAQNSKSLVMEKILSQKIWIGKQLLYFMFPSTFHNYYVQRGELEVTE
jgi:hypothetical protein